MRFRLGLSCVVLVRIRDFFVDIIRIMMFLHAACAYMNFFVLNLFRKNQAYNHCLALVQKKTWNVH